ncbi:hypothetical protein QJS83_14825 [Bdellovibrio sp. 22V]|uniref:RNase H family protein n=1 Tax=Bdellovibrio sp. 22V TaxID=3044166 RepID=UPI0025438C22|nr:RNase H family protein [Bdellovibrio sp. 22V]WII71737.1 hypothetical protein QJS83_14825 [Bdellovibrio sp. 22V]
MAQYEFNASSYGRCTMICDASFCPDTGAAGFAGWINGTGGGGAVDGGVREKVRSSNDAEFIAVINCLHMGLQRGLIRENFSVLIQCDNENVVNALTGKKNATSQVGIKTVTLLNEYKKRFSLSVSIRWMKGHAQNTCSKNVAHNKCDETAKRHMKRRRSEIRANDCRNLHGIGRDKAPEKVDSSFKKRTYERMEIDQLDIDTRNSRIRTMLKTASRLWG